MADREGHRFYEVEYVEQAVSFLEENVWTEQVFNRIVRYVDLLGEFPDLGTPYNPDYPAAMPPFPCRFIAVPDTPFTLYYVKDDERFIVTIIFIEHQGSNPEGRFSWELVSF